MSRYCLVPLDLLLSNGRLDKLTEFPRLTLASEDASLLQSHDGAETAAVLYYGGEVEGSAITLKGSDGGELLLQVIRLFFLLKFV